MYRNILVAIDPSHEPAREGLEMATQLADDASAVITAITIVEPLPSIVVAETGKDLDARAVQEAMKRLRDLIGPSSEVYTVIRHGRAGPAIVAYAKEHGCDCIVVASHKPGLSDYFLGSTAARVVRHAHCSVHVMR
jgi:nucleotide-binding universal stress UspA family protein